jgi:hypothetical protein
VIETFMILGRVVQFELRSEPEVQLVDRLDTANQPFARQVLAGAFQTLDQDHGINKSLETHKIRPLRGKILRKRATIQRNRFEVGEVVRRHNLRDNHAIRVGPRLGDQFFSADERDRQE